MYTVATKVALFNGCHTNRDVTITLNKINFMSP